jgi:DNA-binding MarR family transcriptional regulator
MYINGTCSLMYTAMPAAPETGTGLLMDEILTLNQARAIASLLPALMRHLFATDDDLATELPLAQLRVCGILYAGPRPMSALSRELGVSHSAMTQIADRLERARLVKRVAAGTDRRIRCLKLTRRGETTMRIREDFRARRVLSVLKRLSPGARRDVLAALETFSGAAAANGQAAAAEPVGERSA